MEMKIVRNVAQYKVTVALVGAERLTIPHPTRGHVEIFPDHVTVTILEGAVDTVEVSGWESCRGAGRYHGWTWHETTEVPRAILPAIAVATTN